MIGLDYVRAELPSGCEFSFGFNIMAQEREIGSIKAFVWSDFNSVQALAETKTIIFDI